MPKPFRLLQSWALLLICTPVAALDVHPPQTALWEEQANSDAIQRDLGFILPQQWKNFRRQGFSSTRPDGGSVKTYYVSEDGAIKLAILLQLRVDARGLEMPTEAVWQMVKMSAEFDYATKTSGKSTELIVSDFALGMRSPPGRSRWARYDLETGAEVQGLWWQNIGIWSVIITMSGSEARRTDIDAAANTLFSEMPFPSAPLETEFSIVGERLLSKMPKCKEKMPDAKGSAIMPTFQEVTLLSLLTSGLVLGKANDVLISPYTQPNDYCVIETFDIRKDLPVTAIRYMGAPTKVWEARVGFAINNGRGGYYQVERLAGDAVPSLLGEQNATHTYLNFSNNKRASVYEIFDGWPSYEAAKKVLYSIHQDTNNRLAPILTMTSPANGLNIVNNNARYKQPE